MADTIREKIIKNFMTRAALIKPASYVNNVSNALRMVSPIPETEIPCSNIIVGRDENTPKPGKNECVFPITIEALVISTTTNSVTQESLLGDLIKAFTNPASPVSTYAIHVQYKEGGPAQVPDLGDKVVAVSATFEVKYRTKVGDPYTQ